MTTQLKSAVALDTLQTPALLLDRERFLRNTNRMKNVAERFCVTLRPHMKTLKSADAARIVSSAPDYPITVSTLREAEYFIAHGFLNITYGVGMTREKLISVAEIQARCTKLQILTDNVIMATEIANYARREGVSLNILIEIDCGGRRGGVDPDGQSLIGIATVLQSEPRTTLCGVLTHAGHSYNAKSTAEITAIADAECNAVVYAAERLRNELSAPCETVSVGSTPTALFAEHFDGVTEIRPGNYMAGDLFQANLGVVEESDIAVSVLATVIGINETDGTVLIDAGALAMSQDKSAARGQKVMGRLFDRYGQKELEGWAFSHAHQEHGFICPTAESPTDFAVGDKVRIYPNHACMTAAPYDRFAVIDEDQAITAFWNKARGW